MTQPISPLRRRIHAHGVAETSPFREWRPIAVGVRGSRRWHIAVPRCLTAAQRNQFFLPPEPPLWCIEREKWPYHTSEWKQWLSDTRAGKNPPLPAPQ
jgi:hypothetical protein